MSVTNYEIKKLLAHHFTGPCSDTDCGFRTVPMLLRAIADWMDEHDIQDPEFDNLLLKTQFEDDSDENFYETATLYYLEPPAPAAER